MIGAMCLVAGLQTGMMSTAGYPTLGAHSIPDLVHVEMNLESPAQQLKRFSFGASSMDDNLYPAVAMLLDDRYIISETANQVEYRSSSTKELMFALLNAEASHPKLEAPDSVCAGTLSDARSVGTCSGVLISPNLVMTAGHCFSYTKSDDDKMGHCDSMSVVFGVTEDTAGIFDKEKVYKCKSVIFSLFGQLEKFSMVDIAVFMIDRPVVGVKPAIIEDFDFNFRQKDLTSSLDVRVLQYPMGMPLSIGEGTAMIALPRNMASLKRHVMYNTPRFILEVPSMHGSSGAPVFNANTGGLVGVLNVVPDAYTNFDWNNNLNCYEYNANIGRSPDLPPGGSGSVSIFAKQLMDVLGVTDGINLSDPNIHDLRDSRDAAEVQAKLIEAGYLDGNPDGKWGERSANALWRFKMDFVGFSLDNPKNSIRFWSELGKYGYSEESPPKEEFDLLMDLALFPRDSSQASIFVSESVDRKPITNQTIPDILEQRWKEIYRWQ